MPHYSILIAPQGPLLTAIVGVSVPRKAAMQAVGMAIPQPVTVSLLIDTGASCTCIDHTIVAQLGLQPTGTVQIRTPSTESSPHSCSSYDVELVLPVGSLSKIIPALPVIDGNFLPQGHHGLLGRDVLTEGRVIYSGPDNAVLLSF